MVESPLDAYSARSAIYARAGIAIALMPLLVVALLEISVFFQDRTVSRLSPGTTALIGTMGLISAALAGWVLFRIRRYRFMRLVALSLAAMVFAAVGWVYVITAAH